MARRPIVTVIGPQGGDILAAFGSTVAGVLITDRIGYDSDECEIRFRVALPFPAGPAIGTKYTVTAAWSDGGGAYEGKFSVQRTSFAGDPESGTEMVVVCRAADLNDALLSVGREHFDDTTLKGLVETVAQKAGYEASVDARLGAIKIKYRLRNNQSRIDFLSEVVTELGGAIKVAGGRIVVTDRGKGKNAGGADLPVILPAPNLDYAFEVSIDDRGAFEEGEAVRYDPKTGRPVKTRRRGKGGKGRTGPVHPSADADQAEAAAEARRREQRRATCDGFFEMPGEPTAFAGAKVEPAGYGADIDALKLTATEIVHEIDPENGWITTVSIERADEEED